MNMSLPDVVALVGHALLLTAIPVRLAHSIGLHQGYIYLLSAAIFVLSLLPLGEMSWAQYSNGIFSDLSMVTILLLGRYLLFPDASKQQSRGLFLLLAITGIAFYPWALGVGMLDPYRWGYLNTYHGLLELMLSIGVLATVLLLAYLRRNGLIMFSLVAAVAGFQLHLMASRNLWDYLLDPLVVIYALVSTVVYFTRGVEVREWR